MAEDKADDQAMDAVHVLPAIQEDEKLHEVVENTLERRGQV